MSESTAVATVVDAAPPYALRSPVARLLNEDSARALITPMLRPGDSYERIIVEVYHAAAKNPDIMKCTPQSIVNAVSRSVRSGLVIGETVHLVPFKSTCQEIYDYKGRIQLICNAGAARSIDAICVYANEKFEYTQGTSPSILHVPIMNPKKRGEMIGAYALADLGRGRFKMVVLSVEEIEQVRQTYSKTHKSGAMPYWYAQKTCVHRIAKLLPKNPELAKVVAMFEHQDAIEEQALADDADQQPTTYPLSDGTKTLKLGEGSGADGSEAGNSGGGDAEGQGGGNAPSSFESAPTVEREHSLDEQVSCTIGDYRGCPLWQIPSDVLSAVHDTAIQSQRSAPLAKSCKAVIDGRDEGTLIEPTPDEAKAFKATRGE